MRAALRESVRAIVVGLSLLHAGCLVQSITTEVAFRDPTKVALTTAGQTIVAAAPGEANAPLGSGRIDSGDSSAAYQANAIRTPDGSIFIEWATKLPLRDGERTKVLDAEPMVLSKPLAAIFGPDDLAAPHFVLPLCATLAYHASRFGGGWLANGRGADGDCLGGAGSLPYRLETDWSNVTLHEKTRVDHGIAWMTIALSILAFTPFAIIIDTAHPKDIAGGQPTQVAFTIGIGALIAAFSGSMIPTLVAQDRDVWVRR